MIEKAVLSWSGGKDCCYALHLADTMSRPRPKMIMTTLTREYKRISMHGVREELLSRQAESLGIKLKKVFLPPFPDNKTYEREMGKALEDLKAQRFNQVQFADLFLEDIRTYREEMLKNSGLKAVFPIWGMHTGELAKDFIGAGFKAAIVCIDSRKLDQSFAGRIYDRDFLNDLPKNVDPCGEYGEFHTFVYDGPGFNNEIKFSKGEIVLKDQHFYFCDLIPQP